MSDHANNSSPAPRLHESAIFASRRRKRAILLGLCAFALIVTWFLVSRLGRAPNTPHAADTTVVVSPPLERQVVEWDSYVGRFEASRVVEVRPRVSGQVTSVRFRDGEVVRQGQLLFTIDARPFEAALARARAVLASARSDLALARSKARRAQRLLGEAAISPSEADELNAKVEATVAALDAAKADVSARELDLEFSKVRAPIGGIVSDRRVDAGNQVAAGEGAAGTLLTTINAIDPIYFSFNSSEALYLKAKRSRGAAGRDSPVEIRLQDEADYRWRGTLDFTDNGFDPRSGTIRGRATVSNPNLFLTPGMFGDMRLADAGPRSALLVPDSAITSDLTRKAVLVVDKDNVVSARPVELGALVGGLRVVRKGLMPQDRVVVSGVQLVQPGQKVQVRAGSISPARQTFSEIVTVPQARTATIEQP
ncbi:efflux RND transporter periplasmic adaptor subunit [Burkholderia multivorans]|uniref:efflux RND transporter periplasmic adaptor subunit n=1 Tax=Burkholderia multivorans TaxID=87883 RepID=UPI0020188A77|nr:efflux RND transporter periplasmic adaptor subunit [Burkholderia multivorans]MCL4651530.1 efflux RND transporter periplasmic adaptor subunit [Burkholderia multivorans]MCL4655247.1 efflux RND transporter periplasmic adaptor subunit [Burkholderia multivorans]MCO1426035.1 efflux RND transporter periplasmic adaptor subunit [Burkholderia multivorans]UQN51303.1 efflux RND transporter periplasmic adaptor subunit [Burkholderia multivorans]UQN84349.1 efflux RND transporter periplasmic adaptor subuni